PRPPPPQAGAFGRGERWRREKTASPAAHPAQRSVAALLGPCASARRPPGATPRRRGGCSFVRTSAQREGGKGRDSMGARSADRRRGGGGGGPPPPLADLRRAWARGQRAEGAEEGEEGEEEKEEEG
ncbi:unnamed protein product, partial [Prorocentrum cordatum]